MKHDTKYTTARKMLLEYLSDLAVEKGITQEEISLKTGFTQGNISRMFAGKYSPSLDNFIILAESVNAYFFIIDKDADDDLVTMMQNRWGKPKPN
jgi:transcriptional regulator with XRE-family HTH domain